MKKDRNCGMPYPAYPPYAMPINQNMAANPGMMNIPNGYANTPNMGSNTLQEQLNNMQGQINMLDKRLTNLESALSTKDSFNGSNYHVR